MIIMVEEELRSGSAGDFKGGYCSPIGEEMLNLLAGRVNVVVEGGIGGGGGLKSAHVLDGRSETQARGVVSIHQVFGGSAWDGDFSEPVVIIPGLGNTIGTIGEIAGFVVGQSQGANGGGGVGVGVGGAGVIGVGIVPCGTRQDVAGGAKGEIGVGAGGCGADLFGRAGLEHAVEVVVGRIEIIFEGERH